MNFTILFGKVFILSIFTFWFTLCPSYTLAQNRWIGITPSELAPGARPLGKLNQNNSENSSFNQSIQTQKIETENLLEPINSTRYQNDNLKDFSEFHSNLGEQPIVEKVTRSKRKWVGVQPGQLASHLKPLGSLQNQSYLLSDSSNADNTARQVDENKPVSSQAQSLPIELSIFANVRPYFTTNVLRTKEDEVESGVLENTLGTSLATRPIPAGQYITLVPKLDFLMQWANYNDNSVSDLLDYRFGMVKGTMDLYLPLDFRISPGLEYDFLHSQFSGDKLFDAVAPSLSVQKIFGLNDSTFLMIDGLLKYSSTQRVITFPTDDIFPDDGDNLQIGLNLNFMKSFGPEDQFIIMPGLGISRTEYLKNNQNGRVDMVYFAGISGIWQPLQWLSFQAFGNFSAMNTNGEGELLLGKSSKFKAWDLGGSVSANHTF